MKRNKRIKHKCNNIWTNSLLISAMILTFGAKLKADGKGTTTHGSNVVSGLVAYEGKITSNQRKMNLQDQVYKAKRFIVGSFETSLDDQNTNAPTVFTTFLIPDFTNLLSDVDTLGSKIQTRKKSLPKLTSLEQSTIDLSKLNLKPRYMYSKDEFLDVLENLKFKFSINLNAKCEDTSICNEEVYKTPQSITFIPTCDVHISNKKKHEAFFMTKILQNISLEPIIFTGKKSQNYTVRNKNLVRSLHAAWCEIEDDIDNNDSEVKRDLWSSIYMECKLKSRLDKDLKNLNDAFMPKIRGGDNIINFSEVSNPNSITSQRLARKHDLRDDYNSIAFINDEVLSEMKKEYPNNYILWGSSEHLGNGIEKLESISDEKMAYMLKPINYFSYSSYWLFATDPVDFVDQVENIIYGIYLKNQEKKRARGQSQKDSEHGVHREGNGTMLDGSL